MSPKATGYHNNNEIRLVKGGHEYFELLEKIIQEAKATIHLQTYIFDGDGTGLSVAKHLMDAAKRNVKVYVLLDGYASQKFPFELIEQFRLVGIHFQWFYPLFKSRYFYVGRRLHHKLVVIDGTRSLVAGLNISDRYNDTPESPAWLDWALYVEGEVSPIIEKVCITRIKRAKAKLKISFSKDKPIANTSFGHCAVRVRVNDWVRRKVEIYKSYSEMFRSASSHIIIMSPYFMPGNEFMKRISQATKRGVKIQVILAGTSDILLAKYAERFLYRWLLKNKVEIYEYQRSVVHGKIATYDNKWVTAGSYNLNNLSAFASIELNLDVDNKPFARQVEDRLTDIITSDCLQITEDVYNGNTNFIQHLLQRFAYDIIRLLLFLFTFYFKQKE